MAFTVEEFRDLIRLLEQQPEWRAELRRLLLSEELLTLPQLVQELAQAQKRTEDQIARLVQAQSRTEGLVRVVIDDLGALKGSDLERRYQERAPSYFRSIILRAHALSPDERVTLVEDAIEHGQLTDQEGHDLMLADTIVRGRSREGRREVYLLVEVSWGVGTEDVRRARDRAALLAKTGAEAIPIVAGHEVTRDAQEFAQAAGVWQVTDGHTVPPAA